MKALDKRLGVKQVHVRPGVKSKANTRCIGRMAKHSNGWDLAKELNQRMAEVHEII
jgi:hypothetical protein